LNQSIEYPAETSGGQLVPVTLETLRVPPWQGAGKLSKHPQHMAYVHIQIHMHMCTVYIYVTYNIRTYINYILIYLYVSKWHTIANLLVFTNLTFEVQKLSGLLAMSGAAHQQLKEMDFGDIMGNPQDICLSRKSQLCNIGLSPKWWI
jgi:hypothetical protein